MLSVGLFVAVVLLWLGTTNRAEVWPVRNTLQYHVFQRLDRWFGPTPGPKITVRGTVRDAAGAPLANARVLVAGHEGTPYSAESDAQGQFAIANVPAGAYVPVAGAQGYANTALRDVGLMRRRLGGDGPLTVQLSALPAPASPAVPAQNFRLDPPETLGIAKPIPSEAVRRTVHFSVGTRQNQTTLYYTPNDGKDTLVPLILAVYPGAADTWEVVSFPLTQAGYAVLAVGPAYALDLEQDVDDLERLLDQVQAGAFPRADPTRIGIVAGSYSGLHVFRMLQRNNQSIDAALFLGPPTDLFEMRRQFAVDGIVPPFGLDQALIALGYPDRNPEPYWRYSARYHARSLDVPMMLIHSKQDEIIPFAQSELLSDDLTRLGVPHELYILESMGHYLRAEERTPALDELFALSLRFLGENLR